MELIDRYLQSVKWMLPRKQQDDVIRELSDEILSQVEEKESALGRPLTEDEQVALLKQLGHPMLLASRYSKQRYLIDPTIFAIYWMVLRLVLAVTFFGLAVAVGGGRRHRTGRGQRARHSVALPLCRALGLRLGDHCVLRARRHPGQVRLLRQMGPAHSAQALQVEETAIDDGVGRRPRLRNDLWRVVAGRPEESVLDLRAGNRVLALRPSVAIPLPIVRRGGRRRHRPPHRRPAAAWMGEGTARRLPCSTAPSPC